MELEGIKGLWSLRVSTNDPHDTFLVVSFIGETRILAMNSDDILEETEIDGFLSQAQTLLCQNALHDQIVQASYLVVIHFTDVFFLQFNLSDEYMEFYLHKK